jgi:hypothetical protein
MWKTPSLVNDADARDHDGLRSTRPDWLVIHIARPSSPGGRKRIASFTWSPSSAARVVWIAKRDPGAAMG